MRNPWTKITDGTKNAIIRWSYLVVVVAATVTLIFTVRENRQLVAGIQNDRKRVTYDLCLDQNARHDELIQFLRDENATSPVAIRFVNLLAAKRNCTTVVVNLFGSPPENAK